MRFRLLTLIVFTGGIARLTGVFLVGLASPVMLFGLTMELLSPPAWRSGGSGSIACATAPA